MKKVGVTGAAGFIGSHLCERLLAEGYEVVGVDDLSYGSVANLAAFLDHPRFTFEVLDCTQRRDAARGLRRLRRDRAPGRQEDPALRRDALDARGQRGRRRRGVRCRARARRRPRDHVDLDVYGNATPPFARGRRARARPADHASAGRTRSRSCTTSTSRSRWPTSRACSVTILRLFSVYGPRNHLSWWGGPHGHVHRVAARRRADGDPRRRPADAHVHVRRRHGRRLRPRAASAGVARRGHQHRRRRAD